MNLLVTLERVQRSKLKMPIQKNTVPITGLWYINRKYLQVLAMERKLFVTSVKQSSKFQSISIAAHRPNCKLIMEAMDKKRTVIAKLVNLPRNVIQLLSDEEDDYVFLVRHNRHRYSLIGHTVKKYAYYLDKNGCLVVAYTAKNYPPFVDVGCLKF